MAECAARPTADDRRRRLSRQNRHAFAAGETSKTITVEVKSDSKKEANETITIEIKGDTKNEANETFYVDRFDNSDNSLFAKMRGIGTILNDD